MGSSHVCTVLVFNQQPIQLSLAIPPRVGKMSTGDGTTTAGVEKGKFCLTVGPVMRTAGILT